MSSVPSSHYSTSKGILGDAFPKSGADMNNDNIVNIADIIMVANIILTAN